MGRVSFGEPLVQGHLWRVKRKTRKHGHNCLSSSEILVSNSLFFLSAYSYTLFPFSTKHTRTKSQSFIFFLSMIYIHIYIYNFVNKRHTHAHTKSSLGMLRQDPLDLSFWSFLTFVHHGIENEKTHLL